MKLIEHQGEETTMNWKQIGRLAIAPVLALGMAASLTAYHTAKPVVAKAAVAAPSATPLDDNSVSALLALDKAMETLAARVTPAIVNVAVTSKPKADEQSQAEIPDDMRQFFGPGFNFRQQQGPQIEHGIGSGVIIS
ncbi:MAG TPA: hypothetical protein VLL05_20465, partial [Terriglobales bacterium]|nr:hypothetical protein [Terriglobales bacterium]